MKFGKSMGTLWVIGGRFYEVREVYGQHMVWLWWVFCMNLEKFISYSGIILFTALSCYCLQIELSISTEYVTHVLGKTFQGVIHKPCGQIFENF